MNRLTGYMLVSLAVHAAIASIGFAVGAYQKAEPPPLVVDFSIQKSPVVTPKAPQPKPVAKAVRSMSLPAPPKNVAEAFPDTAAKREESPDSLFTSANNVSDDSSSAIPEKNSAPVSAPDSLETMKKSYLTCNFGPIRDKVMRELAFPPEAIEKGWHGCLKIAFLVHCDGRIDSIRVLASSGHLVLDQSAVEAVKNAAPYPKSPRKVEIQMPISYRFE